MIGGVGQQHRVRMQVEVVADTRQAQQQIGQLTSTVNTLSTAARQAAQTYSYTASAYASGGVAAPYANMATPAGMPAHAAISAQAMTRATRQGLHSGDDGSQTMRAMAQSYMSLGTVASYARMANWDWTRMTAQRQGMAILETVPIFGGPISQISDSLYDRYNAWRDYGSYERMLERRNRIELERALRPYDFQAVREIMATRQQTMDAAARQSATAQQLRFGGRLREQAKSISPHEGIREAWLDAEKARIGLTTTEELRQSARRTFLGSQSQAMRSASDADTALGIFSAAMSRSDVSRITEGENALKAIEEAMRRIAAAQQDLNRYHQDEIRHAQAVYEVRMKELQVTQQKVSYLKQASASFGMLGADDQYKLLNAAQLVKGTGSLEAFSPDIRQLLLSSPLTAEFARRMLEKEGAQSPIFQELLRITGQGDLVAMAKDLPKIEADVKLQVELDEDKLARSIVKILKEREDNLIKLINAQAVLEKNKVIVEREMAKASRSN
jgi:hypothetical protein